MQSQLPKTFFPFVWHFLKPYKMIVCLFIALGIASGFYGPLSSMINKHIVNLLPQIQKNNISSLFLSGICVVMNFIIFDSFTWRGMGYIEYKYIGLVKNNIIHALFGYVVNNSNQFFQNSLAGSISSHISTLADNITRILSSLAPNFIRGCTILIVSFIVSYNANPVFCYILMIWFVTFVSISTYMARNLILYSDINAENESIVSGQVVDSITNHGNIRIFARKSFELFRIGTYLTTALSSYKKQLGFMVFLNCIQAGMIALMMSCNIYFLIHFFEQGLITVGDFILILSLSMELGYSIWHVMFQVDDFNQAYGKCKQSLSALIITPEIQDVEDAKPLICSRGSINFNNVQFNYKDTKPLYENMIIEITSGQKVGLVGYSGGGKTTFVNLVLRLYDLNSGCITIDNQDISLVTQDSLRANIAMIPQDPALFHRSLMDNIRYGRIDASDDEVIEAAKKAHAHEFISMLPEGYNSLVGERGVKLSGGQRQRIAIARAILKDAPILILDEATSQLDSVTESYIQESLLELMQSGKGKTTIVIAHRLSTLLSMDRILVFDKGRILEDGTHDELIAKAGVYKQLWDAQVGGFLGGEDYSVLNELKDKND